MLRETEIRTDIAAELMRDETFLEWLDYLIDEIHSRDFESGKDKYLTTGEKDERGYYKLNGVIAEETIFEAQIEFYNKYGYELTREVVYKFCKGKTRL